MGIPLVARFWVKDTQNENLNLLLIVILHKYFFKKFIFIATSLAGTSRGSDVTEKKLIKWWWIIKGLHLFIIRLELVDMRRIHMRIHTLSFTHGLWTLFASTGVCLKVILFALNSWTSQFPAVLRLSLWIRGDQERMCPCMYTVCGPALHPMSSHYEQSGWPSTAPTSVSESGRALGRALQPMWTLRRGHFLLLLVCTPTSALVNQHTYYI